MSRLVLSLLLVVASLPACAEGRIAAVSRAPEFPAELAGQAEISRYALTQVRYGEPREGHAVLVFVTEDFLPKRQVKSEGMTRDEQPVSVLKLNAIRRFETGIYDYSMMRSVFLPIGPAGPTGDALKVTASVQDWCGQVWLQFNRRGGKTDVTGHSYFEAEGEESFSLDGAWWEDELWTRARLDPTGLPTGAVRIVPGAFPSRLDHQTPSVESASAKLEPADDGLLHYRLAYDRGGRVLELWVRSEAPYRIERFEERRGSSLVARGERTHTVLSPYWNQGGIRHDGLRADLGLDD